MNTNKIMKNLRSAKNTNKNLAFAPNNSLNHVNEKILPFFSSPVILKKILDQEKNIDNNLLNPEKKLIYKIIKLNENLVKSTTSIKKYNLKLDSWLSVGNKSEFILFMRNNLYYNLKFRLSNILYKIEKFTPVLKFNSLLNNINLFAPKRLFKPQSSIRFTYRMIQINDIFNFKKTLKSKLSNRNLNVSNKKLRSGSLSKGRVLVLIKNYNYSPTVQDQESLMSLKKVKDPLNISATHTHNDSSTGFVNGTVTSAEPSLTTLLSSMAGEINKSQHKVVGKKNKKTKTMHSILTEASEQKKLSIANHSSYSSDHPNKVQNLGVRRRINCSTIQLQKLLKENGKSIKYILLKLNELLNEIENTINIKNKLIKIIKIKNIKNLSNFDNNNDNNDLVSPNSSTSSLRKEQPKSSSPVYNTLLRKETARQHNLLLPHSRKKKKNLRRKMLRKSKKLLALALNSLPNHHLKNKIGGSAAGALGGGGVGVAERETYSLLIGGGMVNENKVKIEETMKSILLTKDVPMSWTLLQLQLLQLLKYHNYGKLHTEGMSVDATAPSSPLHVVEGEAPATSSHHSKESGTESFAFNAPLQRKAALLLRFSDALGLGFDTQKDTVTENSNPVDLLYFNSNLKKPVINQYLKSMSIYNMIKNGTKMYYSNIIGFNFKKRVRAYLPFIKSISVASYKLPTPSLLKSIAVEKAGAAVKETDFNSNKYLLLKELRKNRERLTSPYPIHAIRKVVGSLDKKKFFGIYDPFMAGQSYGRGIENNRLINNIYKLLYLSFKSMHSLISKPVFIIKSNKIIIQLFYFLLIPKILKHKKSETKYRSKKKKMIYKKFVENKKEHTLITLYQRRLQEKEEVLLHRAVYLSELAPYYGAYAAAAALLSNSYLPSLNASSIINSATSTSERVQPLSSEDNVSSHSHATTPLMEWDAIKGIGIDASAYSNKKMGQTPLPFSLLP